MRKDYKTIREVVGPLMLVDQVVAMLMYDYHTTFWHKCKAL